MDGARLGAFLAFVGIFAGVYQLGSMTEVDEETAAAFMAEFGELVEGIDAVGIFVHNVTIALPMFIPGFGAAWGLFSAWSTGFAFAAITTTAPGLADIPPLSILFLSPFGVMELAAYSLGISRSFLLMWAILKKTGLAAQVRPALAEAGVAAGLLLAGGYIEYHMIEAAAEDGLELPGF